MKMRMWIGSAVLATSITGCGSGQQRTVAVDRTAQTTVPVEREPTRPPDDMCALMMVNPATTQVSAEDTSDGVAIVFTTADDTAALQERVQRIADMHNQMASMHGDNAGMRKMQMVPSHATVEQQDDGARIVIVPDDPAQVDMLRQRVRMHTAMIAKGECPMRSQMGAAEQEPEPYPTGT